MNGGGMAPATSKVGIIVPTDTKQSESEHMANSVYMQLSCNWTYVGGRGPGREARVRSSSCAVYCTCMQKVCLHVHTFSICTPIMQDMPARQNAWHIDTHTRANQPREPAKVSAYPFEGRGPRGGGVVTDTVRVVVRSW